MSLRARRLVAILLVASAAGCADKLTIQQAAVEDAFQVCRAEGPSTKLDRVDRDGRFSVIGPQAEAQRVHDCMVRPAQPRPGPGGPLPAPAATTPPPTKPDALLGGRLPGTWRGTLSAVPAIGR